MRACCAASGALTMKIFTRPARPSAAPSPVIRSSTARSLRSLTNHRIDMNKTFAILTAGAFAVASASAFPDDKTPSNVTPAEQAKMKQEADARKAAMAQMTAEEKAAAKKAADAERLQRETTMEKRIQNPQGGRAGISKSVEDSKAGPTPRRGTMNTPEANRIL